MWPWHGCESHRIAYATPTHLSAYYTAVPASASASVPLTGHGYPSVSERFSSQARFSGEDGCSNMVSSLALCSLSHARALFIHHNHPRAPSQIRPFLNDHISETPSPCYPTDTPVSSSTTVKCNGSGKRAAKQHRQSQHTFSTHYHSSPTPSPTRRYSHYKFPKRPYTPHS